MSRIRSKFSYANAVASPALHRLFTAVAPRRLRTFAGATAAIALGLPSLAHGADRIYWTNGAANKISFANLDASVGGDLPISGAVVDGPYGLTLDPASGRIYWANNGPDTLAFANLDGNGGGAVNTTGSTINNPAGVAVDPAAGRLYFASYSGQKIAFANLNGSGASDLNTTGATSSQPVGVAVDPAAGKIYWGAQFTDKIAFANLNGTGGGELNTTGATVNDPAGVAVDRAAGRIYWANQAGNKISFASLAGGGGGDLNTTGATVNAPVGVALDPDAGRIYWANRGGDKLSYANLNGTGGGDIATLNATVNQPSFPALLDAPLAVGAPQLSGGPALGSALECSTGSWGADMPASLLYRAPQSFAFQWRRDGADITGASASTYTVTTDDQGHALTCHVTAQNSAGSAVADSAAVTVPPRDDGTADTTPPTGTLSAKSKQDVDKLALTVGTNEAATASGKASVSVPSGKKPVTSKTATATLAAGGSAKLKFKFKKSSLKKIKKAIAEGKKPKALIAITLTDGAGNKTTVNKSVKLKD